MSRPAPPLLQGRAGHAPAEISPTVFGDFIDRRFTKTGVKPEAGVADAILDLAATCRYDVQRLAHEAWDDVRARGGRKVTLEDLHASLARLLSEQERSSRRSGSG